MKSAIASSNRPMPCLARPRLTRARAWNAAKPTVSAWRTASSRISSASANRPALQLERAAGVADAGDLEASPARSAAVERGGVVGAPPPRVVGQLVELAHRRVGRRQRPCVVAEIASATAFSAAARLASTSPRW